ncbi:MAG: hypothetical protein ABSB49_01360 [Polyangia bacterium]
MFSARGMVPTILSIILGLSAIGCGGSSTGSGADGSYGGGGEGGTGAAGGSDGSVAASADMAIPQHDVALDSPMQQADGGASLIDASGDASVVSGIDGGVTLGQLESLFTKRCVGCHSGTGSAATRIDLSDNPDASTSLYARLIGPLLLETYCGEHLDAGSDTAVARSAIVPGAPGSSFLYLKITGTQPSPGTPPANCGVRMPRVLVPGVDGGPATSVACDSLDGGAANCLGAADIDLVLQWIREGAPQ